MFAYFKRLLRTGAAYQGAELIAKAIALITLPIYTRHVDRSGYGAYQALFTAVILASILLRAGLGEAFVRFYFGDEDHARRQRIARSATAAVAWSTTLAAILCAIFASDLSRLLLGSARPSLFDAAVLGLWSFTNLEMAYAQLRVDERALTYLKASIANVMITVALTVGLVVFAGEGARGLLLGNFGASALVVLGLWWVLRRRFSLRMRFADLRPMLAFGLPTVPADASVYALQVADRLFLYRDYSPAAAGEYSVALQLATVVFLLVRGFQYAWPPLAYSVRDEHEAARLYSLVTTYFSLLTGVVVSAAVLLGRYLVRLLAAPEYAGAYRALPWLALAWSLYGLYLVMIAITGRARSTRRNLPAALLGLGLNVGLLFALVPESGAGLGIAGAGIALCGAYIAMLGAMVLLTRSLLPVRFEWRRLATLIALLGSVSIGGDLLLPATSIVGLFLRLLWLALIPAGLILSGFFSAPEIAQARALRLRARARGYGLRPARADRSRERA